MIIIHRNPISTSQQWNFKAKFEESQWLMIEGLLPIVEHADIEEKFTYLSADINASIYDEVSPSVSGSLPFISPLLLPR